MVERDRPDADANFAGAGRRVLVRLRRRNCRRCRAGGCVRPSSAAPLVATVRADSGRYNNARTALGLRARFAVRRERTWLKHRSKISRCSHLSSLFRGSTSSTRLSREFNDAYYFESHETLEDLWMVTPWPERNSSGDHPARRGLRALRARRISGHHQAARCGGGEDRRRGRRDVRGRDGPLLAGIARARDEISALGPDGFRSFDESRRPRIEIRAGIQ